jgi:hypothetical protein
VGSDGELEEEVDMDRLITDQDREQAAELKVKANKAFAGEYPLSVLVGMRRGVFETWMESENVTVLSRGWSPSLPSSP